MTVTPATANSAERRAQAFNYLIEAFQRSAGKLRTTAGCGWRPPM